MAQVIKATFQLRRGLLEAWERNNPILAKGEPSFVLDKNALKIGDGVTPWKELEYISLSQEDLAKAIEDYFKENPGSGTGADGRGIVSIARTDGDGSAGTIDTYTITYTDNTASTFTVYNGKDGRGITSILRTSGNGAPGSTDTYTINYTDNSTNTFTVYNGKDGENGTGTSTNDDIFLIEVYENDAVTPPIYAADKTLAEILEASSKKKIIVCKINFINTILPLLLVNNKTAIFSTTAIISEAFIDDQGKDERAPYYINVVITNSEVQVELGEYSVQEVIQENVETALTEAKNSGEFDGRGITSIRKTSGDSAPGTPDISTIEYTDGSTSTFSIYNGKDGSTVEVESKETQIFQVSSFDSLPTSNVNLGDFGIIKTPLINDKYSYSAYVYTENGWAAMDGNYSADNVYFDEDLIVTTKIGTIQSLTNGQATLSAKGKTLKQVFSSLIAERKTPTATLPSGTIEWTNYENGNYLVEVGETIIPAWKTTFSAGSYTYGPATGVTPVQAKVYLSTNSDSSFVIGAGEMDGKTGKLSALTINDTSTKHYAKVEYGCTDGASTPRDNFGDDHINTSKNLPIQATSGKTDTSTYYIQGYRKAFFGSRVSPIELTSYNIRSLTSNVSSFNASFTVTIDQGATQVVIAVPQGRVVKKVEDNGAFGQDILEAFDKYTDSSTVNVGGADATSSNIGNYSAKYNVYVYNPSTPLGSNTYTVILDNE